MPTITKCSNIDELLSYCHAWLRSFASAQEVEDADAQDFQREPYTIVALKENESLKTKAFVSEYSHSHHFGDGRLLHWFAHVGALTKRQISK
ncbi:hypothetical protein FACS1894184_20590 [Clostridia bacterium]|nr:hypothetical protein FACS1894184_20590 [Clostridia bacterium]